MGKNIRNKRKNNLKNSKKRNEERSLEIGGMENGLVNKFALKRQENAYKPKMKKYRFEKMRRMEQNEVRKAVLKDHQHQKANMEKIIRNFREGGKEKKKRASHSKHGIYENKFNKLLKASKDQAFRGGRSSDLTIHHEPSRSFNNEQIMDLSLIHI